ncbi:hypothetical protein GCM10020360_31030 [Nonlabens tegetincola]
MEQGYEATAVTDITSRAGVSRSSFFNYFDGKAATIWYALDEHLDDFAHRSAVGEASLEAVAAALGAAPPHTLALAIANAEAMGVGAELGAGRALRQARLAAVLADQLGARGAHGDDALAIETLAAAQAAAVCAAIWSWATRGAGTHRLDAEIQRAVSLIPGARRAAAAPLRVAVIGTGAIGSRVVAELAAGRIAGVTLAGVVTRREGQLAEALAQIAASGDAGAGGASADGGSGCGAGAPAITDFGDDLARAVAASDLVVECAGIAAARVAGPVVVAAGRDFFAVSVGALAETDVRAALLRGPGALLLASGAIGGLDLLASAARAGGIPGGITRASITSTKQAGALVQPWMQAGEAARVRRATEAFTLFEGGVEEAVAQFPGSLNVACALAQATGLWGDVRVRLVADPAAERTTHVIEADGAAGRYRFELTNAVAEANPTSSAVVAESVLRGIAEWARPSGSFR